VGPNHPRTDRRRSCYLILPHLWSSRPEKVDQSGVALRPIGAIPMLPIGAILQW
jgi:hypothetical protein